MPIPEEIKQSIIDDLREDRLTFDEIAAKRLGDPKKKNTIGYIAKCSGFSRKDRRGKSRRSREPQVKSEKPISVKPLKILTFGSENRLALLDEAITIHKSLLPQIKDPYKMDKWSAALDRLLNQRREEEAAQNSGDGDLLDKILGAIQPNDSSAPKTV